MGCICDRHVAEPNVDTCRVERLLAIVENTKVHIIAVGCVAPGLDAEHRLNVEILGQERSQADVENDVRETPRVQSTQSQGKVMPRALRNLWT